MLPAWHRDVWLSRCGLEVPATSCVSMSARSGMSSARVRRQTGATNRRKSNGVSQANGAAPSNHSKKPPRAPNARPLPTAKAASRGAKQQALEQRRRSSFANPLPTPTPRHQKYYFQGDSKQQVSYKDSMVSASGATRFGVVRCSGVHGSSCFFVGPRCGSHLTTATCRLYATIAQTSCASVPLSSTTRPPSTQTSRACFGRWIWTVMASYVGMCGSREWDVGSELTFCFAADYLREDIHGRLGGRNQAIELSNH